MFFGSSFGYAASTSVNIVGGGIQFPVDGSIQYKSATLPGCTNGGVLVYNSDSWHCGSVMPVTNGIITCVSSACSVSACMPSFGDCDGLLATGCEEPLNTTSKCGGCNIACPASTTCRTYACTNSICTPTNTTAGTVCSGGTCDGNGSCVATSSPPLLYVTNMESSSVSVVNTFTGLVVTTIPTGAGTAPGHIGLFPTINRAYVADLGTGSVHVIDTASNSDIATISTTKPIGGFDVNQTSGKAYGLDLGNGTPGTNMHVFDSATNTEIANIAVGVNVQDIRVDSSTNRAYITDFTQGLKVLDLTNNTVIKTIAVNNYPHGIAVDSPSGLVYVTQVEGDTVSIVDVESGSILSSISVGTTPQWVALNSTRTKAYVTNEGSGSVSIIDTTSRTVTGTIPVGTNPYYIVIDPITGFAYVSNTGSNTVSVINTNTDTLVNTISVGTSPVGLAIKR